MMRYWLYNMAITLAAPFGAGYLAASSRHRAVLGRFFPAVPDLAESPIWIHACSVGEVAVAQPILRALADRYPTIPRLLTTTTVTGRARAEELSDIANVAWFPFDHPISVAHFLREANPRLLILIETELWPNVLRLTSGQGIPVALVNGRLSERHFRRYMRSGRFAREMISRLTLVSVQDETYADRFAQLGMNRDRIHVTGNIKFDGMPEAPNRMDQDSLRTECGIPADAPVIVFGSTRPGDERLAIDCWQELKDEWPDLRIVVAPRHVERASEIAKLFSEPVQLRSGTKNSANQNGAKATIVDTYGELIDFYTIATVVIVGGSFDSAIQGHNPIEPAAMGSPTVFGPHMRNFAGAAESLVNAGAAVQLAGPEQLKTELAALLRDTDRREHMGRCGQEAVLANRGALQRTIELLESEALKASAENHTD